MAEQIRNGMLQVNINPMEVSSLMAFVNISNRLSNTTKDVCFLRYIGYESHKKYIGDIENMDKALVARKLQGEGGYLRLAGLEMPIDPETANRCRGIYESRNFQCNLLDVLTFQAIWPALDKSIELYKSITPGASDSMVTNVGAKLVFWLERYLPLLFDEGEKPGAYPKLVFGGTIKAQEYLFLYLLVNLGCDVLYLNPKVDATLDLRLLNLSRVFVEETGGLVAIPAFDQEAVASALATSQKPAAPAAPASPQGPVKLDPNRLRRSSTQKTEAAAAASVSIPVPQRPARPVTPAAPAPPPATRELNYEELAALSPAIVMISVYNKEGECFKTGSGVVVSEKGYILTNFHVACEGAYYGIRFEEDEKTYETDELVKYNQYHDLAVIRIQKNCTPIRLYKGEKDLVRGQRVVAIGSPLGLFNSVSDGIISGFRTFDAVSMIQFTAPISHGSSGGALLNLYGELIGIITAGFDDGQNINLAVDYKTARLFAGGFF